MRLKVAFFGVNTKMGDELTKMVKSLIERKNIIFEIPKINDSHQYRNICIEYDIVILDSSIEDASVHNYRFAMPFPADFILIVSRTPLPLNFYGLRDASLDEESGQLLYNSPLFIEDEKISNKALIKWLEIQIDDLVKIYQVHPEIIYTQKDFFKKPLTSIVSLLLNSKNTSKAWETESDRRKKSGQIFISFRNLAANGKSLAAEKLFEVKKLVESGDFLNVEKKTVRFFPPYSLSNEIMSEQRRWQVLSMIDRFIGPAEEVWIYEIEHDECRAYKDLDLEKKKKVDEAKIAVSPQNYYYNSWWTLGELLTLSYRGGSEYVGAIPKIRILKEKKGKYILEDVPKNFLPVINKKEKKRMARWYANCDPSQMAPESVLAIRAIPEMPLVGFLLKNAKYFNDRVWSEDFWENLVLDCPNCRTIGKDKNKFNVHNYLWTKGDWFSKIKREDLKDNKVKCNNCGACYKIKRKKTPHYYWIPPLRREIVGKYYLMISGFADEITDDYDYSLVKLPVFILVPKNKNDDC